MKRFSLLIIIAIMLFTAFPSQIYAVTEIGAGAEGTYGGSGSYEIHPYDWFVNTIEDLADKPIKKPNDIYEFMYQQAKEKPAKVALSRTIARLGLTPEQAKAVLGGQDISRARSLLGSIPILSRLSERGISGLLPESIDKKGHGGGVSLHDAEEKLNVFEFTPTEIVAILQELSANFEIEMELADLESELEADTVTTEIFANGNESDSGFDLLVDLNVIDQLLFARNNTLLGPSGPSNPPGANEIKIGAEAASQQSEEIAAESHENGPDANTSGRGNLPSNNQGQSPQNNNEPRPFTSLECYADQNFDQQIRNYRTSKGLPEPDAGNENGSGGSSRRANDGNGAAAGTEAANENKNSPEEPPVAAEPGSWARNFLCPPDQVWCLELEAKMKRESAYLPNANCIACHIEKINDAYSRTVKANLTPSKATGLLFAVPLCKNGFHFTDFLNINFVLLPSPIITPPNDDIIVKDVFAGNLEKFWKQYYDPDATSWGLNSSGLPTQDDIDAASERASSQLGETAAQNATAEINNEVNDRRNRALQELVQQQTVSQVSNIQGEFKVLESEIDQMSGYFQGFAKLFSEITASGGPCDALLNNKEYCS